MKVSKEFIFNFIAVNTVLFVFAVNNYLDKYFKINPAYLAYYRIYKDIFSLILTIFYIGFIFKNKGRKKKSSLIFDILIFLILITITISRLSYYF